MLRSLLSHFLSDIGERLIYFGKLRVHELIKPAVHIVRLNSTELFLSFGYFNGSRRRSVR